jgi:hydroxybutyrate-dimer hydrolase
LKPAAARISALTSTTRPRLSSLAEWPHRVAFKAAHSKQSPEKDWGEDLLK